MSDYLPFEYQVEIIKRLPVKPLLQFRSVSKRWKALIDSSEFIAAYSVGQTQLQHLLVWYENPYVFARDAGKYMVSFVDDETLKLSVANKEIDPTALGLSKLYKDLKVVGSSQGLFCLYDCSPDRFRTKSGTTMAFLWNPSIRKSVGVVVPGELCWPFVYTVVGFGVCPITNDPTLVMITNVTLEEHQTNSVPFLIEVFTLSEGSWKIPTSKLPNKPLTATWRQVAIDKFIYWFAFDNIDDMIDGVGANKLIMSFDMTTQEISLIDLPNCFTHQSSSCFSISKVRESLALLEYSTSNEKQVCGIWMMNRGAPNLFTKMFTINTPYALINIWGFMTSGRSIMAAYDKIIGEPSALVFNEPCSEEFKYTSIFAKYDSFYVDSYMETLLLLDLTKQRPCNSWFLLY